MGSMAKLSLTLIVLAAGLVAQENPISASIKMQYSMGKSAILRAADKMPEGEYAFKPTDAVRSFGQLVGHVADAQYMFCSAGAGMDRPKMDSVEKTKTTKADLVQALKDAFAYCDKAYDAMTDATAGQMVKFFGRDNPKVGVLSFNNMHNYEHYGNMVTYMRLKDIVPPTSEPRPEMKKQ